MFKAIVFFAKAHGTVNIHGRQGYAIALCRFFKNGCIKTSVVHDNGIMPEIAAILLPYLRKGRRFFDHLSGDTVNAYIAIVKNCMGIDQRRA